MGSLLDTSLPARKGAYRGPGGISNRSSPSMSTRSRVVARGIYRCEDTPVLQRPAHARK
jgi:hypothetical protein